MNNFSSPMNFSEVFKEIAQLYPSRVSLQNAELYEGGGFLLPEINIIYDTIDELYNDYEDDKQDWRRIMNWNIACGIRAFAKKQFKKQKPFIVLIDVPIEDIEKRFYKNLKEIEKFDPGNVKYKTCPDMLKVYTRDIEPGLEKYWGLKPIEPKSDLDDYHWVVHDKNGKFLGNVDQSGNVMNQNTEEHDPAEPEKPLRTKKKKKE